MKEEKSAQNVVKQEERPVSADIRTVVFDIDGTLYDNHGLACRMFACLWWALPLLIIDRRAHGALWQWEVNSWWHKRIFLPTMVWLINRHHFTRPQALTILEDCKKRGLQIALYSDYGAAEEKLDVLGIDKQSFDLIITAPELGDLKPSAACARKVLEMLHADPTTTLFIGDRPEKDGEAAKAVGAHFMLI